MNAADGTAKNGLLSQVRKYLRDMETNTDKGLFWDDWEIILALNSAQDIIVSKLIDNKQYQSLNRLVSAYLYNPTTHFWRNLPSDYLHYISGQISTETHITVDTTGSIGTPDPTPDEQAVTFVIYDMVLPYYKSRILKDSLKKMKTAKVYLGGESASYLWTYCQAIFIVNDKIGAQGDNVITPSGTSDDMPNTPFVLYYYRKPSKIWLNRYGDYNVGGQAPDTAELNREDFPENIYDDIAKLASSILSFKETQTQRDIKNLSVVAGKLNSPLAKTSLYLRDSDITIMRSQKDDGNQRSG